MPARSSPRPIAGTSNVLEDLQGKTFMAVAEDSFWWLAGRVEGAERARHQSTSGLPRFPLRRDARRGGERRCALRRSRCGDRPQRHTRANGRGRNDPPRGIPRAGTSSGATRPACLSCIPVALPGMALGQAPHTPDKLAEDVPAVPIKMPAESPAAKAAQCAVGWTIPHTYQEVHERSKELRIGP